MADAQVNAKITATGGTAAANEIEKFRKSIGGVGLEAPKGKRAVVDLADGLLKLAESGGTSDRAFNRMENAIGKLAPALGIAAGGSFVLVQGFNALSKALDAAAEKQAAFWAPLERQEPADEKLRRMAYQAEQLANQMDRLARTAPGPKMMAFLNALALFNPGMAGGWMGLGAAGQGRNDLQVWTSPKNWAETPLGPTAPAAGKPSPFKMPTGWSIDPVTGAIVGGGGAWEMDRAGNVHGGQWFRQMTNRGTFGRDADRLTSEAASRNMAGFMPHITGEDSLQGMQAVNDAIANQAQELGRLQESYRQTGAIAQEGFMLALDAVTRSGGGIAAAAKAVLEGLRRELLVRAAKEFGLAFAEPWASGMHLAAAAKFTAGAMLAGGLENGMGGGGGGAVNAPYYTSSTGDVTSGAEATIIIEGGILDMSDPRQRDALAKAIEDLRGYRQVTLRGA